MSPAPAPLNRYDLYEQAAQSPDMQARFLRALLGDDAGAAPTLGEDFCAAGAVSRAWLQLDPSHRAVCVDHDAEPLKRLREFEPDAARLTVRHDDVMGVTDPVDLIAVLNFSICELHERDALIAYFRHARSRLTRDSSRAGLFVLDLYGGANAFAIGESDVELRGGARYVWEQREADPLTGRVVNAMHFFPETGPPMRNAFVYDWRLWSAPELTDALREAGFGAVRFYDRLGDAMDGDGRLYLRAIESADELDDDFVISLVARPA